MVLAPKNQGHITFQRGQVVANRYTVLDMIGRGGMGCIYKVFDNTLKEEVALKTLLPQFAEDELVVERFYNEARIARQLSHPNIIRVHDIGLAGNILYISMEFLQGRSLRGILDSFPPGQRLPVKTTLRIVDELCAALEYAHQHTVHRDIKPENVMVCKDGSVKLMDFGISKLMAPNKMTATSVVMGTPHYMSPEQLKDSGRVDARADIYSIGVMLYEIVTGHLPTGVMKPVSQVKPDLPVALDEIVSRCTEPDPAQRYSTARELRTALQPVRQQLESGTAGPPLAALAASTINQRVAPRRALGVLLCLLIATTAAIAAIAIDKIMPTTQASAPGPASSVQGQFESLAERIRLLEARAKAAQPNLTSPELMGIVDRGVTLWGLANELEDQGNSSEAVSMAWDALHCFLAVLTAPVGMVYVPAGPVVLGDPQGSGQLVSVRGFFIEEDEVTWAEFLSFCEANEYRPDPRYRLGADPSHPVRNITCYDALAYAASKNRLLPTEAEWARAAYREDGRPQDFPWSGAWNDGVANLLGKAETVQPATPKSFAADRTFFGCFDMAGNVAEWTRSLYQPFPYRADDGRESLEKLDFGASVVVRGGSFSDADANPLTSRRAMNFEQRDERVGFRCVQPMPMTLAEVDAILARL